MSVQSAISTRHSLLGSLGRTDTAQANVFCQDRDRCCTGTGTRRTSVFLRRCYVVTSGTWHDRPRCCTDTLAGYLSVLYGYFGRVLLGAVRIFWQDTSRCCTDILAGYFSVLYGYIGRILLGVVCIFWQDTSRCCTDILAG